MVQILTWLYQEHFTQLGVFLVYNFTQLFKISWYKQQIFDMSQIRTSHAGLFWNFRKIK